MNTPQPTYTIRACFHCTHSAIDDDARMVCNSPDVSTQGETPECVKARAPSGPCGIEARFLQLKAE